MFHTYRKLIEMKNIAELIKQHTDSLLFVALGGANEIGANIYAYHYKGKWLVVDFGIGFSDKDISPGVEVVLPDVSFLEERRDDIVALIITHAHEDHLGAVPKLWDRLGCPVYTTAFTGAVLRSKLKDAEDLEMREEMPIIIKDLDSKFSLGPFHIELFNITHSVPEMSGLLITAGGESVFHTGDWKFDEAPMVGEVTDQRRLEELGNKNILAMVSDSTNILNQGSSGSEGELHENLLRLVKERTGRGVIVTTFASHLGRIKSLGKVGQACGRKVVLVGHSLWRMYHAAVASGYLTDMDGFLQLNDVKNLKKSEILYIVTGCQGEDAAAMSRIVRGVHADVKLEQGDSIMLASKIIPGNEKRIFDLLDKCSRNGVETLTELTHHVHVSGHPSRDEVAKMYSFVKPHIAIPVHGGALRIHEHAKFAKANGAKHSICVANGDVVYLNREKPYILGKVDTGYLAVDGKYIIKEKSHIFKERRGMRDHGIIFVLLMLNRNGNVIKNPRVIAPGLFDHIHDRQYVDSMAEEVKLAVNAGRRRDDHTIRKLVKGLLGKLVKIERGKEPQIMIQIERFS